MKRLVCIFCLMLLMSSCLCALSSKVKSSSGSSAEMKVLPASKELSAPHVKRDSAVLPKEMPEYSISVRLDRLSGSTFSVTTKELCSCILNDSERKLSAGTGVALSASGNIVVAVVNSKTFKQNMVTISGRTSCKGKISGEYDGRLEITARNGRLRTVCITDIESYTAGVLVNEAALSSGAESLKAQAVAIRTYALYVTEKSELCDSTHCQVYKGCTVDERAVNAAKATAGRVLLYKEKPVCAMYCSDNGGVSEAVKGTDYLKAKNDPVANLKHITWRYSVPRSKLAALLGLADVSRISISECTASGRASRLQLSDSKSGKTITVTADAVKNRLGSGNIKSTLFSVSMVGNDVFFQGRGFGHGMGLCQAGCAQLAQMGWTWDKILGWYYDGAVTADIGKYKKSISAKK